MHNSEDKLTTHRPIAFIGMPGCGKSSLGQLIAENLGLRRIDSDTVIAQEEGMSIPEIFELKGEAYFRDIEKQTILNIIQQEQGCYILSTGGGAVMTPEVHEALHTKTMLIYISAHLDTLWDRLKDDITKRPLLNVTHPKDALANILQERAGIYKHAHIIISSDKMSLAQMAKMIEAEITR